MLTPLECMRNRGELARSNEMLGWTDIIDQEMKTLALSLVGLRYDMVFICAGHFSHCFLRPTVIFRSSPDGHFTLSQLVRMIRDRLDTLKYTRYSLSEVSSVGHDFPLADPAFNTPSPFVVKPPYVMLQFWDDGEPKPVTASAEDYYEKLKEADPPDFYPPDFSGTPMFDRPGGELHYFSPLLTGCTCRACTRDG